MENKETATKPNITASDEIDLLEIFKTIWQGRKLIAIITILVTLLGLTNAMLTKPLYQATTSFYSLENQKSSGSSLGAAAAMLGMSGGNDAGIGGYKANDIIKSRKIRTALTKQLWQTDQYKSPVDLYTFWKIKGTSDADKLDKLLLKLEKSVTVAEEKKSNFISSASASLVTVTVKTGDRELSKKIANKITELTNDFMQQARNKNIKESIIFIEQRLKDNKKELIEAEENLKQFKKTNQIVVSAELQLELARLQREVTIKQEVYLTLVKQKEMSLIDVVKQSNVISVLDEAVRPEYKVSPKRLNMLITSFILGLFLGIAIVVGKKMIQKLKIVEKLRN